MIDLDYKRLRRRGTINTEIYSIFVSRSIFQPYHSKMTILCPGTPPDIGYMPDHEKYLARGKRRQATEHLDKHVPEGFPSKLTGSLVWDPDNLAKTYNWNYHLTPEDIDEINKALQQFKGMPLYCSLEFCSHSLV